MGSGVVILAAGGSSRMGRPKQLLPFRGRTMLRHAAEVAVASGLRPVLVVLGDDADRMGTELDGLPVTPVLNPDWDRGMGTSVRAGVRALLVAAPDADAVVLTLCDLPLVTPDVFARLVETHRGGHPVAACRYGDAAGVPTLFDRSYFPALQTLADGEGAKRLVAAAGPAVGFVAFPDGSADVDTPADYRRLVASDATIGPISSQ